jgi:glycosyltransferase involved in cell wall biosynthesis
MFSVIIPLYNKIDYIFNTICSVLNQTVGEFEIIVVDDGSTDGSPEVVKSFRDDRIRIITQANSGVSSARNTGIINSRYEYIAFLDADDYWKTSFLEEIAAMTERVEADMYATNYFFDTHGKLSKNSHTLRKTKQSVSQWFLWHLDSIFFTSSIVVKKQIFEKTGMFDVRISYGEDVDMWMRIALYGDIAYSNKYLAIYNKTADSLTAYAIDRSKLKRHLLSYLDKYDISNPTIRHCVSLCQLKHGLYYYLFVDRSIFETYVTRNHLWRFPLRFAVFYILPTGLGRFLYRLYFNLK